MLSSIWPSGSPYLVGDYQILSPITPTEHCMSFSNPYKKLHGIVTRGLHFLRPRNMGYFFLVLTKGSGGLPRQPHGSICFRTTVGWDKRCSCYDYPWDKGRPPPRNGILQSARGRELCPSCLFHAGNFRFSGVFRNLIQNSIPAQPGAGI